MVQCQSHFLLVFNTQQHQISIFNFFSRGNFSFLHCFFSLSLSMILAPHSPHSPPHSLHPHSPHSPPHSPQSPFGSSLVDAWSQKPQVGVVRISCTSASSVR